MFAFLRGVLESKEVSGGSVDRLVIDVSGVGFEVWASSRTVMTVGQPGDDITVFTWLAVRENELTIFGFQSQEERKLFLLLMTVSGIGPRLALAIVGTLGVRQFIDAVLSDDKKTIGIPPGVGPKVAQRILLELKPKVEELYARMNSEEGGGAQPLSAVKEEVRAVLEGLGYTLTEINMVLKRAQEEPDLDEDVESLVRYSLKMLGSASLSS